MAKTYIYLTSGSSWSTPVDWNNSNNTIECIGGGGGGSIYGYGNKDYPGGGGGGGAYSKKNNILLSGSISYSVGSGGNAETAGGDTYFKSTSDVLAKGGSPAIRQTPSGSPYLVAGGIGGLASSSVGDTKYNGGNGGGMYVSRANAGGGGGAGGPSGDGKNGGSGTGGDGDNSATGCGAGGTLNNNGGNGTTFSASYGCGGGGGGVAYSTTTGKNGGNYGGGGGGCYNNTSNVGTGGSGIQGLIIISYEPIITGTSNFFKLF